MKLVKVLVIMLLWVTTCTTAFAGEIVITEEHTHSYQQEYDESYHWEVCSLCGILSEKLEHSLNTTYKYGKNSCIETNECISKCDNCDYTYIGHYPNAVKHTPGLLSHDVFSGIHVFCKTCGAIYQTPKREPYILENGTGISHIGQALSELPCYARDKYGNYFYLDKYFDGVGSSKECSPVIEFDDNNEYIKVSGICSIPEEILSRNTKDIKFNLVAYGVVEGTEHGEITYIVPDKLHRIGDTFEFEATINLRDAYHIVNNGKNIYGMLKIHLEAVLDVDTAYEQVVFWTASNDTVQQDLKEPIIQLLDIE